MSSAVLEELVRLIGMPAAIEVARVYGGSTLRVPQTLGPLHPLTVAIGAEAAQAIAREFAGCALDIPAERSALIAWRNETIVAAHGDGASVHALARDHRLSRKMIRKILSRGR